MEGAVQRSFVVKPHVAKGVHEKIASKHLCMGRRPTEEQHEQSTPLSSPHSTRTSNGTKPVHELQTQPEVESLRRELLLGWKLGGATQVHAD